MPRKSKGFTLIEMLVVIGICAALLSLALEFLLGLPVLRYMSNPVQNVPRYYLLLLFRYCLSHFLSEYKALDTDKVT